MYISLTGVTISIFREFALSLLHMIVGPIQDSFCGLDSGACMQDNHVCTRFVIDSGSSTRPKVKYAVVLNTATKEEVHVYADTFVLAAGDSPSQAHHIDFCP